MYKDSRAFCSKVFERSADCVDQHFVKSFCVDIRRLVLAFARPLFEGGSGYQGKLTLEVVGVTGTGVANFEVYLGSIVRGELFLYKQRKSGGIVLWNLIFT